MKRLILFFCLLLASCGSQAAFAQSVAKHVFLTNTSSCSWTVPTDWNPNGAIVEALGSGYGQNSIGGGGGAYAAKTTGLTFAVGTTISCAVAATGFASVSHDTWFNSTSFLKAAGANFGTGGRAADSVGDVTYSGGSTGGYTGAGAAGPHGPGNGPGGGLSGSGDNGFTAGVADTGATDGASGTQWDATHGIGSGGAGTSGGSDSRCGQGGLYGGGSGNNGSGVTACFGGQGIIVITYYPRRQVSSSVF